MNTSLCILFEKKRPEVCLPHNFLCNNTEDVKKQKYFLKTRRMKMYKNVCSLTKFVNNNYIHNTEIVMYITCHIVPLSNFIS